MTFDYNLLLIDDIKQSYYTKIYSEVKEEIFREGIIQKHHTEALEWFFFEDKIVPLK